MREKKSILIAASSFEKIFLLWMLRVASSYDDFVRIFKYAARLEIDENSHKDSTWKPHKISTRPPTIKK